MVEIDRRKAALIAELEVSRGEMRAATRGIESSLNVVERARHSVERNLGSWILGAVAGGFLVSRLFGRLKRPSRIIGMDALRAAPRVGTGVLIALGKVAFEFAKPSLLEWISNRIASRQNTGRIPPNA